MTQIDPKIQKIWNIYIESRSLEHKHTLILNYIWLVKYVLHQMSLPSNSILNTEDFLNIGILGLHEAIERYEPTRGVKFESYAIPRIRGIIQDELRKLDWLSRTARKKAHQYLTVSDELRSEVGREVSPEEIRKKLDVTPEQYHTYLNAAAAAKASLSLSEPNVINSMGEDESDPLEEIADTNEDDYLTKIENEERINYVTEILKKLNERKRLVMMLYYYENLTFKDIGKVLKVSESRVCQIHTQVVSDMRKKLYEFDNA